MTQTTNKAEADTGIDNIQYDLVSILYHSLESAEICEQYIMDAEEEGDEEVAQFFQQIQADNCDRADRAKALLKKRL